VYGGCVTARWYVVVAVWSCTAGLLNIEGFYDSLLGFLDHLVREGFVRESARRIVLVASTPAELIDQMEGYKAPESLISMARKESKGQAL